MAFRKGFRRKPAVQWLPITGYGEGSSNSYIASTLSLQPGGTISTTVHSLVPDYPAEAILAGAQLPTLADYGASGYRLRRIVGKIMVGTDEFLGDPQVPTQYPECAWVGAGFMVLRVDPTNGAPLNAATPGEYSPLDRDSIRDPWIWRRTWFVGNDLALGPGLATTMGQLPRNNLEYGAGTWDGPHVDAKTNRRVSAEERLFLIVSCQMVNNSVVPNTAGVVRYAAEFRYLTSPLRVMGNRRNASR